MDFLKKLFKTKSQLLLDAVDNSDATEVQKLLKKGANANANDEKDITNPEKVLPDGAPALHKAVLHENNDVVKLLLDYGAGVNTRNKEGDTALFKALSHQFSYRRDIVKLLLDYGADVNAKSNEGDTPLHKVYDEEEAQLLLSHGADVNTKNNEGSTPLHKYCNKEKAELLLSHGADVNAKNNKGYTPLHEASNKEKAELLISHGADVNAKNNKGYTPLHEASNKEKAELLISHGADVNAKDKEDWTPLHIAVMSRSLDVVDLLLANGADVNARGWSGDTPLHKVAMCDQGRWAASDETSRLLRNVESETKRFDQQKERFASFNIDYLDSVSMHSNYQKKAEQIFGEHGEREAQMVSTDRCKRVELLLAKEADINASNNEGETLLHMILSNGDNAVAKLLVASGADVDIKNAKGVSSLHMIEEKNNRDLMNLLFKQRNRPDAKTSPYIDSTASLNSSDHIATLEGIIKGTIENHFLRIESQFTGEPEKQMLLQKVASTVTQFLGKVSEKAALTASDGKMHSFSSFDPSRKIRLEVTTIPCSPEDACAYFSNLFPGGYPEFMSKTLYLPNVYQPSLAEGIQIFAHLVVLSYVKDQRASIVVNLCVAPNGEENQPNCPLLVLPAELLTPEQQRKWASK